MSNSQLADEIRRSVRTALAEDVGSGDITAALIAAEQMASARVITREDCIVCGRAWVDEVFAQLDPEVE
ncbi:MAG: nicotinate-nucleotide diphosphorylase (carboxylating), partial [Cellvibrionaceae bacterium]|nr:nicotinate-nucleotide diphosphorylase (carboxylating) [Cellvibrionaceae bacterium]